MDILTITLVICFVLIALLLVMFFFLGVFKTGVFTQPAAPQDYVRRDRLLSSAELAFYRVLVRSVGENIVVCPKVRIADLISVATTLPQESNAWWKKFGPIAKKHVDFTLCEATTMRHLAVIELDDSSHQTQKGRKRDTVVDTAMQHAGLPILHIPYSYQGYRVSELRAAIQQAIGHTNPIAQRKPD